MDDERDLPHLYLNKMFPFKVFPLIEWRTRYIPFTPAFQSELFSTSTDVDACLHCIALLINPTKSPLLEKAVVSRNRIFPSQILNEILSVLHLILILNFTSRKLKIQLFKQGIRPRKKYQIHKQWIPQDSMRIYIIKTSLDSQFDQITITCKKFYSY